MNVDPVTHLHKFTKKLCSLFLAVQSWAVGF